MTIFQKRNKVTEYCDQIDREYKIAVMKKLNVLQENSERQFSEFRNKINDQKEYFTEEIKTLLKNQAEILELKNSINKIICEKTLELGKTI